MSRKDRVTNRTPGQEAGLGQAGGGLTDDDLVMIGFAFDHGSDGYHSMAAVSEQRRCCHRQLPGARHPEHVDLLNSRPFEI